MESIIQRRTACNRDCPDACSIVATIRAGRVVRLQGDTDHPVTRGFLCHRTSRFLDRHYAADRLTAPLIRDGDAFRPAAWDECLDRIAAAMLRFRGESGAASILQYRCGGSLGMMKHVGDYFFQRFGPVTVKSGDVCAGAGEAAQRHDFGAFDSNDLLDIGNSRTIFLWGKNVAVSSVHLIPLLKAAQHRGARVVLIDPVHHQTAQWCDLFVQPRAGTDSAVALGMASWLFEHGGIDPRADQYCAHLGAYRELAFSKPRDDWAKIADVAPEAIEELAEAYADGPSAILIGWGLQRRRYGATTVRAIDALAAVSGNLGIAGGGASFYYARSAAFDLSFRATIEAPRKIPEPLLGPGILAADDPPIRMAWVSAANPVAMLPDSNSVAQALASRELTVVVDSFLTDTARCADIVLPTTTMLEEDDLVGAYGHHWLAELRPIVPPAEGVKTDYEIIQLLAKRVGLADEFSAPPALWKDRMLRRVTDEGIDRKAFHSGAVRSPFAPQVLFADRQFATPSGKVQLLTSLPDDLLTVAARPTLRLAALATEKAQSSQWPAASQVGEATATVHPDAAGGFGDGDLAELRSATGRMPVRLRFDNRQRADIVLMDKGGWLHANRCANALIAAELTDDGQCAVYYDTAVEIVRPS
jgi:anaerobic selenocysteine-containing dehydrogenase